MKVVLAIDPGSAKCGMVVVRRDEEFKRLQILWREIVATDRLAEVVQEARDQFGFNMAIVGGSTRSRSVIELLARAAPGLGVLRVDESNTTVQARERYWEHHPRRGWRRLLPASLQVPPEPVDDFAALLLAERVLLDN